AAQIPVDRRVPGADGADVARQGLGNHARREVEARGDFGKGHIHLVRVLNRLEDLILEAGRAAIPKLRGAVAAIDERRSVTRSTAAGDALRDTVAVGEGLLRVVTGAAGESLIAGETGVEEELAAERHFLDRERVIVGNA